MQNKTLLVLAVMLLLPVTFLASPTYATFIDLKPVQICEDDGTGCAGSFFFEDETSKIWDQAGLGVNFLSGGMVNETDFLTADILDGGSPGPELEPILNAANLINDPNDTLAINLIFVENFESAGLFGLGCGSTIFQSFCGSDDDGDPLTGILVDSGVLDTNRLDTIAHEIGHVLDLLHTVDDSDFSDEPADNLMTRGSQRTVPDTIDDIYPDGAMLDQLTENQIATALDSRFVQVPAPATVGLFALGLSMLSWRRRAGCA